jgi:flagella basal body P-ring formation protein FlgA
VTALPPPCRGALEGGGKGDGIKVRNSSSGRVIQGWVVEKGVVETRF